MHASVRAAIYSEHRIFIEAVRLLFGENLIGNNDQRSLGEFEKISERELTREIGVEIVIGALTARFVDSNFKADGNPTTNRDTLVKDEPTKILRA